MYINLQIIKQMKKLSLSLLLVASIFAFTGCDGLDDPSPSDTRAGSGLGNMNGNLPDGSYGLDGNSGLSGRGISNIGDIDPNNINPEDIVCTVYFGFDQYAVAGSERAKIQDAAAFYASNPSLKAVLVARTDCYGTEEYNLLLSDKRGASVKQYLETCGLSDSKSEILAVGKAGSTPDVAKDSPEARHDRRVDVVKLH